MLYTEFYVTRSNSCAALELQHVEASTIYCHQRLFIFCDLIPEVERVSMNHSK